ncbi:MAG: hypothetical protein QXU98_14495, partial [Candidatus Parvarchaeota archaeon]
MEMTTCLVCGHKLIQIDDERSFCPNCTFPYKLTYEQVAELKSRLGAILWSLMLKNRTLLLCNGYRIDVQKGEDGNEFIVRRCNVYGDDDEQQEQN